MLKAAIANGDLGSLSDVVVGHTHPAVGRAQGYGGPLAFDPPTGQDFAVVLAYLKAVGHGEHRVFTFDRIYTLRPADSQKPAHQAVDVHGLVSEYRQRLAGAVLEQKFRGLRALDTAAHGQVPSYCLDATELGTYLDTCVRALGHRVTCTHRPAYRGR